VVVILCMHASGVKHTRRVIESTINLIVFSQEKLIMGVLSLVFEPSTNRPCIDEWSEYLLMLTVYFGTPNMLVTLWFELNYGTNPPLGTLMT
jgi:hypothetical protein